MKNSYILVLVKKYLLNYINELTLQLQIDEKYYIKNNGFNLIVLSEKTTKQEQDVKQLTENITLSIEILRKS